MLVNCEISVIQLPIPKREAQETKGMTKCRQYDVFVINNKYDADNLLISFESGKDIPILSTLYKQLVMKTLDTMPDYK